MHNITVNAQSNVNAQKPPLKARLNTLQASSALQSAAHDTSRAQLHKNIAEAVFFKIDAENNEPGFREAELDAAGIGYRKTADGKVSFYGCTRLVFGLDAETQASTISEWAQSWAGLEKIVLDDPEKFAVNGVATLVNTIYEAGGLRGVRGEKQMTAQQLRDQEDALLGIAKETDPNGNGDDDGDEQDPKKVRDALLKTQSSAAKKVSAKALLGVFPSAFSDDQGHIVLLGRLLAGSSDIEIVGSGMEQTLINDALIMLVEQDRSGVNPVLRHLAEPLTPHAVVPKLEKYRSKLFDVSKEITREQVDGTVQKVKQTPRVIIDPDVQEVIITKAPRSYGAVTHAKPFEFGLHTGKAVVMNGQDRVWMERDLIGGNQLAIFNADPVDHLAENNDPTLRGEYRLDLASDEIGYQRRIDFYEIEGLEADTNNGYRIPDPDEMPDVAWELQASPQWLARFNGKCSSQWLEKAKTYAKRTQNKFIGLRVDEDGLAIRRHWDKDTGHYGESVDFAFGGDAQITLHGDAPLIEMPPIDFMLMFAGIGTLPITNDGMLIQGTADGLFLSYATDIASYRSWLPSKPLYDAEDHEQRLAAKARSRAKKGDAK